MFRLSMLLSCIFATPALPDNHLEDLGGDDVHSGYSVTCYMCVNVSDNIVCNQYAIDRPCTAGQTFCHTLHIMDSHGTSVLVNKKCATEIDCQKNKVGCVYIDNQLICVSCCDQDYCNVNVPTNSSNANFDDRNTKMRLLAKNLFKERDKALKSAINVTDITSTSNSCLIQLLLILIFVVIL